MSLHSADEAVQQAFVLTPIPCNILSVCRTKCGATEGTKAWISSQGL